ncbi:MAG: hypothetical protein AAF799_47420 [Myxococcota bacterium]
MITSRCTLPALLTLALVGACDSKDAKPPAKPAPAAAAKQGDAKTPDAKTPTPPHGAANPHAAASPHGAANPHGGGMPPMAKPKKPMGPPRDVTPSGEVAAETVPGLTFSVPKEWEKGTPSNSMRVAQWVLPGPGGDAELVVFRFPGGAGGVEANLNRWKGQFTPPEGKTIDDVTTTKKVEGKGVSTTQVDVTGTYVAAMTPGSEQKHNESGSRMLAAIVEGSGDPFFFKVVGPKATMDVWAAPFETMVTTFATGS